MFAAEEHKLIADLGYDAAVCEIIKGASRRPLERLVITEYSDENSTWVQRPGDALSVVMAREKAESFVREKQQIINAHGYSAFASSRRAKNGGTAEDE